MFRTYIIRMIRSTAIIYQVKQGIQLQKRYISSCFIGNYIYIATIEVTLFIQPRRVSFSKGSPLIIDRITFPPDTRRRGEVYNITTKKSINTRR